MSQFFSCIMQVQDESAREAGYGKSVIVPPLLIFDEKGDEK